MEPSAATRFSRDSAPVTSEPGTGSPVIFKLDSWASWHPLEIEMGEERTVNRGVPLPRAWLPAGKLMKFRYWTAMQVFTETKVPHHPIAFIGGLCCSDTLGAVT